MYLLQMSQYKKCEYYKCYNNKQNYRGCLFKFPVKVEEQKEWIKRCGNITLIDKTPESLHNKLICAEHFTQESFTSVEKQRLRKNAVPLFYNQEDRGSPELVVMKKEGDKFYTHTHHSQVMIPTPSIESSSSDSLVQACANMPERTKPNRTKILLAKIKMYKRQVRNLKLKIKRLTAKISFQKKNENVIEGSDAVRTLVKMQSHKKGQKWSKSARDLSISLYLKSPKLYKHLRFNLKFVLPTTVTITSWLSSNIMPGINPTIFYQLRLMAEDLCDIEKNCVLIFDEMAIKKGLEYNVKKDIIEGFQDLGHGKRSPVPADHATVFMLRGLMKKWQHILSYVVTGGPISANDLYSHIQSLLLEIQKYGLKVRAIVCDQVSKHLLCYSQLGLCMLCPVA